MIIAEHFPGKHSQKDHGKGASTTAATRAVREKGGGTLSGAKRVTTGSVVARSGHSASFDGARWDADPAYRSQAVTSYLRDNREQFAKGGKFGIWDSRSEGGSSIVFDIVDVVPRGEAIRLGKERGEDGIYDLDAGEYVATGGKTYT